MCVRLGERRAEVERSPVDVSCARVGLALDDLRGDVDRGAHLRHRALAVLSQRSRLSEIGDADAVRLGDETVVWLEVAVPVRALKI